MEANRRSQPGARPRSDSRRRLSAGERRERILDAAVQVFAEHGYGAASMGEIAARAGVVPSVIYDHFGSKRELHIELLQMHGEALLERSIRRIEGAAPEELFRENVEAFYEFVEDDPFVWRFLFRDPPSDPEIAAAHRRIQDRATGAIAAVIEFAAPQVAAVDGIPLKRAAWMVAKASQSANNGLAEWWWEHREVPREEIVALATRLLWKGFERLLAEVSGAAPAG